MIRQLLWSTLVLAIPALVGCSSSSKGGGGSAALSCADAGAFCVTTCNLGCSASGGCAITDIAQNQPIVFQFSKPVDPVSVNFSTFSLKTANGIEPVGQFFVEGSIVTFIPEVRNVQGATFFGFQANETYILTLLGGAGATGAIRSTSADRLATQYSCTLRVSRGVVDLDQSPPEAKVLVPATTVDVPRDTSIVLEFSELVEFGPFQASDPADRAVLYFVRRAPGLEPFALTGTPRLTNDIVRGVTTVSFTPIENLPATSFLEVQVTSRVRDLAGTRGRAQTFNFVTAEGDVLPRPIDFPFDNDLQLARSLSGGTWGEGEAVFAALGGDGRHGAFDLTDGQRIGADHYVWNTDGVTILRKNDERDGWLNRDDVVTDGHFYFTEFVLDDGETLEFRGSKPARIFVRGVCVVDGQIIAAGDDVPGDHRGKNSQATTPFTHGQGQLGSQPGPSAGRGGDGAWAADGGGGPRRPDLNLFNGYDGEDLGVPGGHALLGQEVGTHGAGAQMFPTHNDNTQVIFRSLAGSYAVESAAGAGGAGFIVPGGTGDVTLAGFVSGENPNTNPAERGPSAAGGISFPLLNPSGSVVSSEYYLIGGSGGGGGASHPLFSNVNSFNDPFKYWSGGAGGGGGGALNMRVGHTVAVGPEGVIDASGGAGTDTVGAGGLTTFGAISPGGGGSGGTCLLQVVAGIRQDGRLDVGGGSESRLVLQGFFQCDARGGAGSDGYLRYESPSPNIEDLGVTVPDRSTPNVVAAQLEEADSRAGFQSVFVGTNEAFPPEFMRYEIEAMAGAQRRVYSDDPNLDDPDLVGPAVEGTELIFFVQGITVDSSSGEPGEGELPGPWRPQVGSFNGTPGLTADSKNGFRWMVLIDRSFGLDLKLVNVRVVFES